MNNYIVMWKREGGVGFDFVNAKDNDSAINSWIEEESGGHTKGRLLKMIIVETNKTYKVPLDICGYVYYEGLESNEEN
jgi:serine protease inhibitor